MDLVVLLWLLLAGPLWAIIGGYLLPRRYHRKTDNFIQIRMAGIIGGFALGFLPIAYLWIQRPARISRFWYIITGIIGVFITSQMVFRVPDPNLPVLIWFLVAGPVWAIIGAFIIQRRYRQLGLDDSQTRMVGVLGGFAAGPFALVPLYVDTPELNRNWTIPLVGLGLWQIYVIFALYNPENLCVQSPIRYTYLTQQTINGLTIGAIYALMSVGLTLIYSVQGIVSFAHGQFYMIGGYFSFYFLLLASNYLSELTGTEISVNPIWGIPVAGVMTFLIGVVFERLFLRPMYLGVIERVSEYAILITFGFGFFMEYTMLAAVGPFPQRTERFIDIRRIVLGEVNFDNDRIFGPINIIGDRAFVAIVGIVLIFGLLYFLQRTWTGRALRAVSMDKQAAAVTGVDPLRMNTFAFGIGCMLAAMSGAALIPIFAWVPWVGAEMASRSYVIVVLGGLGSVPGALVGGLIVGVVESLGSGCFPDPSKGAAYKEAFGLVIFALVLLLKPTGLFGREQL